MHQYLLPISDKSAVFSAKFMLFWAAAPMIKSCVVLLTKLPWHRNPAGFEVMMQLLGRCQHSDGHRWNRPWQYTTNIIVNSQVAYTTTHHNYTCRPQGQFSGLSPYSRWSPLRPSAMTMRDYFSKCCHHRPPWQINLLCALSGVLSGAKCEG